MEISLRHCQGEKKQGRQKLHIIIFLIMLKKHIFVLYISVHMTHIW